MMQPTPAHHRGMSLPAMLAIVLFLMASVLGLLSYVVFQANLTDRTIEYSQEYTNAVNDIQSVQRIIARDGITDPAEITTLATYFALDVETIDDSVFRFSRDLEAVSRSVEGYLAPTTETVSTYDEIFSYRGDEETFTLSPLVTATSMLDAYLQTYIPDTFPSLTYAGGYGSFQEIIDVLEGLTPEHYTLKSPADVENQAHPDIDDHWFIDGTVSLDDQGLSVTEGYLPVIDGHLLSDGSTSITGTIVVNGDLIMDGRPRQDRQLIGTFYVDGDVEIARDTILGSPDRPVFIFANGNVSFGNNVTVYGYIICDEFAGQQGANFIEGGVYTHGNARLPNDFQAGQDLSEDDLQTYGVTTTVIVETQEQGETTFSYTHPRLS